MNQQQKNAMEWSQWFDFPEITCPNCDGHDLHRNTSVKTAVSFRCRDCNIRFEISNPSDIEFKVKRNKHASSTKQASNQRSLISVQSAGSPGSGSNRSKADATGVRTSPKPS